MRIYVASKFEEQTRVREVMAQLRTAGHAITYDWTMNEQISPEQARKDVMGVLSADALVLIAEKDLNYCGALVEFGIAIGRELPIFVIGDALNDRCIFMKLPNLIRGIQPLL